MHYSFALYSYCVFHLLLLNLIVCLSAGPQPQEYIPLVQLRALMLPCHCALRNQIPVSFPFYNKDSSSAIIICMCQYICQCFFLAAFFVIRGAYCTRKNGYLYAKIKDGKYYTYTATIKNHLQKYSKTRKIPSFGYIRKISM